MIKNYIVAIVLTLGASPVFAFRDFVCQYKGVTVALQANESKKTVHVSDSLASRWGVLSSNEFGNSVLWADYLIYKMHAINLSSFDGSMVALNPNAVDSPNEITDFFEFNENDLLSYTHFKCAIAHH